MVPVPVPVKNETTTQSESYTTKTTAYLTTSYPGNTIIHDYNNLWWNLANISIVTSSVVTSSNQTLTVPVTKTSTYSHTAVTVVPVVPKPVPEQSTHVVPVPEKPTSELPVPEKPTSVVPVPEKPTSVVPVPEKPTSVVPVPEKPTSVVPVPEKPTSEAPAPEKPTSAAPVPEKHTSAASTPTKTPVSPSKAPTFTGAASHLDKPVAGFLAAVVGAIALL